MAFNNQVPDPVFVFRGARSPVTSVTFIKSTSDDSVRYVGAGTQEGQVLVWDLKTKCLTVEWAAHPGSSVLWMFTASAGQLWTLGRHDKVKCWDIIQPLPKVLKEYSLEDYLGFSHCDISSRNGKLLLAVPGSSQESVTVYDAERNRKICTLTPHDPKKYGNVMQMKWVKGSDDKDDNLLVSYECGNITLWDYAFSKVISEVQCSETPICITFDPISHIGMVGTASEKCYTVSVDPDLKVSLLKEVCITNPGLACCVVRPDGKIFVSGGWDYRIRLFSSKKMKPLAVLQYHKKTVECLSYSPDFVSYFDCRYLLAAGSSDLSVSLWKLFD